MLMVFLIWLGSFLPLVFNRFDHETDEQYVEMDRFEKKILNSYSTYLNDYNPMEEGLYESWNWTSDLDV